MSPEQRSRIKEKILSELAHLEKEIQDLQELCEPISPECALGDLARFELMNEQAVSEKTLHEAKIRQNKLAYALRNVDKASYGLCAQCEEEISFERLLILPESTLCIECANAIR